MNISSKLISNIGLLGLGVYSVATSVFYVSAGENGIIYNYLTKKFSTNHIEGYHVRIPFITRPIIFETRTRFVEESSSTANKDLQKVNFTIRVLFRPDPKNLVSIFENLGLSYAEKVLNPLIKEISKSIIANYDAHSLLS
jgi:regulator of protease activity HflC (stomatin/prohibitin superfamily)